jgi:hypothetical protein
MTRALARLALLLAAAAAAAACGARDDGPSQPAQPAATPSGDDVVQADPSPAIDGMDTPSGDDVVEPPPAAAPSQWDFTLTDLDGNQVSLADYRGKTVVLEWFNPQCPFIVYAHNEGPLAARTGPKAEPDVVWLAINSNAPGKQGHGRELNATARQEFGMDWPVLLDEGGAVGRQYSATTTPHMFIIDPQGELVYQGALDNAPLGKAEGGTRVDYVDQALVALAGGAAPQPARTKPYGCSVKYVD